MLKREKSVHIFCHIMIVGKFSFWFSILRKHVQTQNYHFLVVKSKLLQKYCTAAIGMEFSKKYLLDTNLQNNDQI